MIRTISDLLRHYGDRTVLTIGASGNGRRSVVTFEIDHPGECVMCIQGKRVRGLEMVVCDVCHGSGLALELGGEA